MLMPSGKTLRPQQVLGIEKVREAIGRGVKRIMLQLPTGGGKTLLSTAVILSGQERGNRSCFTVPAISLVDQTVGAFASEGLNAVGVIQGDHELYNPDMPTQVASVQTLAARSPEKAKQRRIASIKSAITKAEKKRDEAFVKLREREAGMLFDLDIETAEIEDAHSAVMDRLNADMREAEAQAYHGSRPHVKFVLVDEAHEQHRAVYDWMADEPNTIFIGLSATPWTRGLADHWEELIIVSTIQEMIDDGFLSDFVVYAPDSPDLSKLKVRNGEYTEASTEELMSDDRLVGNVLKTWREKGTPDKTLVFAVNRAHAQKLEREFENDGVRTGYIDMDTSRNDRREIGEKFHSGEIQVVFNVGTLTKGVDWDVRTLSLVRPMRSESLYVQIIGRALRTAPGKDVAIILDHSSTTENLGFVTDIHHEKLRKGVKDDDEREYDEQHEKAREERKPIVCPRCTTQYKLKGEPICPSCGFKIEGQVKNAGPSEIENDDGDLKEISRNRKVTKEDKQRFYSELLSIQRARGRADGWTAHKYRDKFGVWPRGLSRSELPPSPETSSWVRSRDIAYAKSQARR